MITIIKSLKFVIGSETILWGVIICSILSIISFVIFKSNRVKKFIFLYVLGLLIIFLVCDIVWLTYLFPKGVYLNRGLSGAFVFLIFPLLLLSLNIGLTIYNKYRYNKFM